MDTELDYRKTIDFKKMGATSFSTATRSDQPVGHENNFKSFGAAKAFAEAHFPTLPSVHAHDSNGRGVAMWDGEEWLVF